MSKLNPSARLKINRDTFFVPDANGGVYFRNNLSSFRMEGTSVYQWIEKLLPMFNGEHSLDSLTNGLPDQYRERVYEIGEILYNNGFARDVSKDHPHQLSKDILNKYASQIEFLNCFGESGAYRFQTYRQSKILAIGTGTIVTSLVSALLESGLAKFHLLITNTENTDKKRIKEIVDNARRTDQEVEVEFIKRKKLSLQEIVSTFDSILYVSEDDPVYELKMLNEICKREKKRFIPAISSQKICMAGPLVTSNAEACFESAWRSVHQNILCEEETNQSLSAITSAMLANIMVFELFKDITQSRETEKNNQVYIINQETLEGSWHTFSPHPLVTGKAKAKIVHNFEEKLEENKPSGDQSNLLTYLGQFNSQETGLFHVWGEGELNQLPLAQCRIQVVDPLTEGPVKLLTSTICTELTHEEARREAGLTGVEMYVSQIASQLIMNSESDVVECIEPGEYIAIATGQTFSESICRALQKYLSQELNKQTGDQNHIQEIKAIKIEDDCAQFYLQILNTIHESPKIALGKEVFGFPVVWIGTEKGWYRSVGLNRTMALQDALKQVLKESQNKTPLLASTAIQSSSVLVEEKQISEMIIPESNRAVHSDLLVSAIDILKRNNMELLTLEFMLESINVDELAGVYGVLLREVSSI
ncbi:putative thiazole-containing bacteriocin maturation protein [Bacillus sp. AFS077874]|uniref:putative thiazole-containing bacteriocin maturation protein n=1 Tax=unclassified Bacillus (in: firmicutes) TaxID=185979 RepID=UPI000BED296C|nr:MULTISPECIES: putative thiazole-containing bacteriocin maturation protein [unclassified Bacillus (in: firmicutes)]PEC51869.1 putative thiazole-containing bacteriocin maturation protein [Bacillus sp. AFS096315]PFM79049.1 putative thiazole-containing bacteriocin maturation protein [Bacillus sp. AFS077874]